MARPARKHPRFRTKEEIVHDVSYILHAPVTAGTKIAVLTDVCWVWTEFDGKYRGCPHWSKKARVQFEANPKSKLKHEHAVPKRVVMDLLFKLSDPTPATVMDLLSKLLIGVVVTPEEDRLLNREYSSKMPDEFYDSAHRDHHDPWLRYKKCGIEVERRDL